MKSGKIKVFVARERERENRIISSNIPMSHDLKGLPIAFTFIFNTTGSVTFISLWRRFILFVQHATNDS